MICFVAKIWLILIRLSDKMGMFGDHIIDVDNITTSIEEELNLHPLSDQCCIYRVATSTFRMNEVSFTPQIVSIGPFHHGKPELKNMEEHKRRYLQDFLDLSNANVKKYASIVKQNETRLRNCYAENIELFSDEFVKMILVDAAFVIMMLLKCSFKHLRSNNDRIFHRPWMENDVRYDMLLFENQIPFFILKDLYEASEISTKLQGLSLVKITHTFFKEKWNSWATDEALEKQSLSEAVHILDFMRICQLPLSKSYTRKSSKSKNSIAWCAPSATELKRAGVKFKVGLSTSKLDIEFKDGILYFPTLKITPGKEITLRNLQAFEQCHCHDKYINDYIAFITMLVETEKDVEIVVGSGIIQNWLRSNARLATLFNDLAQEKLVSRVRFYYSDIVEDLNMHCGSSWRKWKATLEQDYFNTPWSGISVLAAFVLLILTVIQTVCSVMQV
ncbi:UPF0481 protein At3g47200-like [Euphorbia lathyris]|uniref:UPF0481 protein At3g47200-like n=1 Tax=Euphorbia lathyris TaxID=212925 RepID=UPI003313F961